jgi:hypothetical protein
LARVAVANVPHHVTRRGNAGKYLLDAESEKAAYLELLKSNSTHEPKSKVTETSRLSPGYRPQVTRNNFRFARDSGGIRRGASMYRPPLWRKADPVHELLKARI